MADTTAPSNSSASELHHLLSSVKHILLQELELFGEELLMERPTSTIPTETPMPPKKHQPMVKEEMTLFELPPATTAAMTNAPWGQAASLDELNAQICNCTQCALGFTRTKFVFGVGNPRATLMLVGEAPGADEDAQGEPFVGRAGQLLNKILEAINFRRGDVYICNILKCRPPNNRNPFMEEVEQCLPYLRKQIALIQPKVILCLGLTAAQNLLGVNDTLGRLRGRVLKHDGIPVMVTYHPAALLRNPHWKRPAWEDVQAVRKLHDELVKQ
jgi:uracil-DNA glycosylase family 4